MTDWKNVERKLAALLGGERIPITGRTIGSAPDIEHSKLAIEVKVRSKLPAWIKYAMQQAEQSAKKSKRAGDLPVVILHEKNSRHDNDLVILRLKDFLLLTDE